MEDAVEDVGEDADIDSDIEDSEPEDDSSGEELESAEEMEEVEEWATDNEEYVTVEELRVPDPFQGKLSFTLQTSIYIFNNTVN